MPWAQPLTEAAAEVLLRFYLNLPLFKCGSVIKAYTVCKIYANDPSSVNCMQKVVLKRRKKK